MYGIVLLTSSLLIASFSKVLASDDDQDGNKRPAELRPTHRVRDLVTCMPPQPQDLHLCRLSLFKVSQGAGAGEPPQLELARIAFYDDEADASEQQASREEDSAGTRAGPRKFFRSPEAGGDGGTRAAPVVMTARQALPAQTDLRLDVDWPSVRLVGEGPRASCWAAGLYGCEYACLTHHADDPGGGRSKCRRVDDDPARANTADGRLRRVLQVVTVHAEPDEVAMTVEDDPDDVQQKTLSCTTHTSRESVQWRWEEQGLDGKLSPLSGHVATHQALPNTSCWVYVSTLKVRPDAGPRNFCCYVGIGNDNGSFLGSASQLLGQNKDPKPFATGQEGYGPTFRKYFIVYTMLGIIAFAVLLAFVCFLVLYKRKGRNVFAFLNRWLECGTLASDHLSDSGEAVSVKCLVEEQTEEETDEHQDQKLPPGDLSETGGDGDKGGGDDADPVSPGTKRQILAARRDTLCKKRESFVRLEHVIQEITEQTELATARLLSGQDQEEAPQPKDVSVKPPPPPPPPKVRMTKSCLNRYQNVIRLFEDRARSEATLREREVLQKGLNRSFQPKAPGKDAMLSEDDQSDKAESSDSVNKGEAARERSLLTTNAHVGPVEKGSGLQIDFKTMSNESGTDTVRSKNKRRLTQVERDSSQPLAGSRSFSKPSEPLCPARGRLTNAIHLACARTRSASSTRSLNRTRSLSKTRPLDMTCSLSAVDARSSGKPPHLRQTRSVSRTRSVGKDLCATSRDHSPLGGTTATRASSQSRHSSPIPGSSLNPSRSGSTLPFTPTSSGQGFHAEPVVLNPRMHQSRASQKDALLTRQRSVKFQSPIVASSLSTLDKTAGRSTRHLSPSARVCSSSTLEKKRRLTSPAKLDRSKCPARSEVKPPSKKDQVRAVGFGSGYYVSPDRQKCRSTASKGEGHGGGEGSSPNDHLSLLHTVTFDDYQPYRSSRRHSGDSSGHAEMKRSFEDIASSNGQLRSPGRTEASPKESVKTPSSIERVHSRERMTPIHERKTSPSPKPRDKPQGISARKAPAKEQARTKNLYKQLSAGAHLSRAESTKFFQSHPALVQSFSPLSRSLDSSYSSEVAFHFDSSLTSHTASQDIYGNAQEDQYEDGTMSKATTRYISSTLSPDSSSYFSRYDSRFGVPMSFPSPDSVSSLLSRNASEAGPEKVRLGVSSLRGTASSSGSCSASPLPYRGNSPTPRTPSPGPREAPRPREMSPIPAVANARLREMSPIPTITSSRPIEMSPIPTTPTSPRPLEMSPVPAFNSPRSRGSSPVPRDTSPGRRGKMPVSSTSLIPKTARSVPGAISSIYKSLSRSPSDGGMTRSARNVQTELGGLQYGTAADRSSSKCWLDNEEQLTFEMLEKNFLRSMNIGTDVSSSSSTLNEAREQKVFEELERKIDTGELSPPGLGEWSAEKRGVDLGPSSVPPRWQASQQQGSPPSLALYPPDTLNFHGDLQQEAYLGSRIGSSAIGVWASPLMLQRYADQRHPDSASFRPDPK